MKKYIITFFALFFFCQCSKREKCIEDYGHEVDTTCFDNQFLSIVKEYISTHYDYESFIITSSYNIARISHVTIDYGEEKRFFILPTAQYYEIEKNNKTTIVYTCIGKDKLSFFFKINGKRVYIASEMDNLSSMPIKNDSITYRIKTQQAKGGIWCFGINDRNEYIILSKDVENDKRRNVRWTGVLIDKTIDNTLFDELINESKKK